MDEWNHLWFSWEPVFKISYGKTHCLIVRPTMNKKYQVFVTFFKSNKRPGVGIFVVSYLKRED